MTVQVYHILDLFYLGEVHYILFDLHCLWGEFFEDVVAPVSVEIQACHVGPRHSVDYTVRVDHRYHEDVEVRSQIFRDWRV